MQAIVNNRFFAIVETQGSTGKKKGGYLAKNKSSYSW